MTDGDSGPGDTASLRQRAVEMLQGKTPLADDQARSPGDLQTLLHELQVHQIELEFQNEELRRSQAELDAARARYFDLYDRAPMGYCTVNEQGLILEANLTVATLLGVSRSTLVGRPMTGFILRDDQDVYYLHRKRLFETGAPQACDVRMVPDSGPSFWAGLAATAAQDADGAPTCRIVMHDITERKRVDAALQESEERFRAIANYTVNWESWFGLDGKYLWVSPAVARITGYSADEILAMPDFIPILIPEDDQARFRARFQDALHGTPGEDFEFRYCHRDGSQRWLSASWQEIFDSRGRSLGVRASGREITEHKRLEEAARQEQAFTNAIIASIPGAFYMLDENGRYVRWNAYQRDEIVGKPEDLVAGTDAIDTIHPDDRALIGSRIENVLAHGAVETVEGRVLLRGGPAFRWLLMTGRSMVVDGHPFLVGIGVDITERKQAEDELAHSQAQLLQAQKMDAVGRLAGGVAHDFNNILQAMLSLATVLRLRAGSPELTKIVVEIEAHIKRGAGLTQQLLQFSRRQITDMQRLDLGELASAAGLLLRRLIPEHIRLTVETSPERLWVQGNAGQLQQVLVNLAVNARDAMPAGGTLTVRTSGGHGEAVVEVADTGHGMDEATRTHLFEPFFTTKEPGKGTGLGLSVVHGIIGLHGGRIEVASAPGEGSSFRFTLPVVSAPDDAAGEPGGEMELLHGHGERVLIVEDEDGARQGLAELVEMLGYQVTAVGSGEDAGVLPTELAPALLLTDLMLPGIDGAALAAGLRARWPRLKVVLMSGYTEDEAVRRGVKEGEVRFLQKPFDVTALGRALGEAMGETR